ncbi:MAG: hypothetical protein ACKOWF_18025 [Chloroflexota bacterium]
MSDSSPPLDDRQQARVSGQLAQLRASFPERYDEAQWRAIELQLADSARKASVLRSVRLSNADEPEILFAPVHAAGRQP